MQQFTDLTKSWVELSTKAVEAIATQAKQTVELAQATKLTDLEKSVKDQSKAGVKAFKALSEQVLTLQVVGANSLIAELEKNKNDITVAVLPNLKATVAGYESAVKNYLAKIPA